MPKKLVGQEGVLGTGSFRHRKGCVPKKPVGHAGALSTGKDVCLRSLLVRKVL